MDKADLLKTHKGINEFVNSTEAELTFCIFIPGER
jgi:hypothetical protein